eukprot:symbB.v1.2.041200.t1/scaffold7917.1/size8705/2
MDINGPCQERKKNAWHMEVQDLPLPSALARATVAGVCPLCCVFKAVMENLTTGAVLKDKLTNIASDLISKVDHTVQNLGKTKPSEDAPITFKVVHRGGALVRSGYETTSAQVHQLSEGEIATVVEQAGLLVSEQGWVSVETKDGVTIMRPTAIQRRGYKQEAFESHFESKFERLKAKQRQGGYEDDPRAESSWRKPREESPEERYSDRRRSAYDDFSDRRHDRRDPNDAHDHRVRRDDYDDRSLRDDTRYRHERDDRREDRREDRRDSGREDPPNDRREKPKVEDTGGFVPRLAGVLRLLLRVNKPVEMGPIQAALGWLEA